jgi:hypothetical protein
MSVAPKWQRHRNRCKHCGIMFACWMKAQRFCGRRCAGLARGLANAETGRAGGLLHASRNIERAFAEVIAAWPGMPPEVRDLFHRFGQARYHAGRKSGERAGRRLGWAEALNEREDKAS